MQVLKAVATDGAILTFNIPTDATEVTVGQFFECHIAYHAMMGALRHSQETGEQTMGGVPLAAYLNALAMSLRPFTGEHSPMDLAFTGTSEEDVAVMLMGAVEQIANCMVRHTPTTPENKFEFGGETWYLCEQAVNYKRKEGAGFAVKQVAQGMLLEEYFNNFLEVKLARDVQRVIEQRDAEEMASIYLTPTRIFLAQMALFLRKSPDEQLPQTQEAFDHWHAARIKEVEQLPLSVAVDIRNFFLLTSMGLPPIPSSATGSNLPAPPSSKKAPTRSKSANTASATKKTKGASLGFMAGFGKQGRGKAGK